MRYLLLLLPCLLLGAQTTPARNVAEKKAPATSATAKNYKEMGNPNAPLTIELYTDYECPACRQFYLTELPQLIQQYVDTGKVRLVHRDFVLSQHQHSPVAARYANAAGLISKADYEAVARRLFETQPEWSQKGNVEEEVAKVLSPADMTKARAMVKSDDPAIEESIKTDMAQGESDRLSQTPTLVIVSKGKRETIGGAPPYSVLSAYINRKLGS